MNVYERRRPARVGTKQVEQEQQDICTTVMSTLKKDNKHLILGGIVLLFVFLQGMLIGKLLGR